MQQLGEGRQRDAKVDVIHSTIWLLMTGIKVPNQVPTRGFLLLLAELSFLVFGKDF